MRRAKTVPEIPATLPLVLRPSRAGTIAAFGAGVAFALVGLLFAAAGNVLVALFVFALAAVALFGGTMGVLPRRSELRLDDQGLEVVSPPKTWKAGWGEIERFEVEGVPMGRNSSSPIVRVVYRGGFDVAHEPETTLGKRSASTSATSCPATGTWTPNSSAGCCRGSVSATASNARTSLR